MRLAESGNDVSGLRFNLLGVIMLQIVHIVLVLLAWCAPARGADPLTHPHPEFRNKQQPAPRLLSKPSKPPLANACASLEDVNAIFSLMDLQLSAIQKGDYGQIYNSYTAMFFRETTSLQDFSYFMKSYSIFTKNKSASFGSLNIKGTTATIQGTFVSNDNTTRLVTYFLIRENNHWQIAGMHL